MFYQLIHKFAVDIKIFIKMSKPKTIIFSKLILLFSGLTFSKTNNSNSFLNLKKATAEEIEKSRCKQYGYVA